MKRVLGTVALLLVLTGCQKTHVQIQEDSPGWNCHTMGNRICGPAR